MLRAGSRARWWCPARRQCSWVALACTPRASPSGTCWGWRLSCTPCHPPVTVTTAKGESEGSGTLLLGLSFLCRQPCQPTCPSCCPILTPFQPMALPPSTLPASQVSGHALPIMACGVPCYLQPLGNMRSSCMHTPPHISPHHPPTPPPTHIPPPHTVPVTGAERGRGGWYTKIQVCQGHHFPYDWLWSPGPE